MIRPIAVLSVATAVLATAGCAADVSSGQGSTAPPTKTALARIVLRPSDLPGGWTGKRVTHSRRDTSATARLAKCAGGSDEGVKHQIAQVRSEDFTKGTTTISSDMSSYRSTSDVDKQVALLTNPKTEGCLDGEFQSQLKSELPPGSVVEKASVDLDTGHRAGVQNLVGTANGSATITLRGTTVVLYLGEYFVTGRQLTGTVSYVSVQAPLPTSFTDPIVAAVATRASHA